ncbi:hypothetical protein DFH11DRAFT_1747140 [Phellopilus nigrolimitatus]|nr:hypothetical protein DFH11DRAFT_1747140 [Phellopilus nigrolimitatus]
MGQHHRQTNPLLPSGKCAISSPSCVRAPDTLITSTEPRLEGAPPMTLPRGNESGADGGIECAMLAPGFHVRFRAQGTILVMIPVKVEEAFVKLAIPLRMKWILPSGLGGPHSIQKVTSNRGPNTAIRAEDSQLEGSASRAIELLDLGLLFGELSTEGVGPAHLWVSDGVNDFGRRRALSWDGDNHFAAMSRNNYVKTDFFDKLSSKSNDVPIPFMNEVCKAERQRALGDDAWTGDSERSMANPSYSTLFLNHPRVVPFLNLSNPSVAATQAHLS